MTDNSSTRRRDQTSFQLEVDQLAKIKIIAERFQVSQAQAARWIIDNVDPLTFVPSGRMISTVESDLSIASAASQS